MTNVNIITVGKLKEDFLKGAQAEYSKRLSPFCKLKVVEIAESRLSDNPSQKEIEHSLGEEARSIKPYIEQKGSYSIVLCIEGKKLSSPALAEKILKLGVDGFSTLNFVIGSSFGIADEIKKSCALRLSMSDMTFPHQLARIMLLEQIYRSFQIINGTKYHK